MTITFDLDRYCSYLIAIEAERALGEFAQHPPLPVSPIRFQHPPDPQVELSVMMPVWQPAAPALERALRGLAAQDFGGIAHEIVVADDASASDVARRCFERARLPNARFTRHETNQGGIGNFNWCLAAARGRWIHLLHQDDWVEPGFYTALLRGATVDPATDLRFCRTRLREEPEGRTRLMFDEAPAAGVLDGFLERQVMSQRIQFAGAIFTRRAVEAVGGFDPEIGPAADWEFWARIGSRFKVHYEPAQLATYVLHPASWTNRGAAGFADACAFQRYHRALQRMLGYVEAAKRRATATGFFRNMLRRVLNIAVAHRQAGTPQAGRPVAEALFVGCREAGLLPDVERILFGIA